VNPFLILLLIAIVLGIIGVVADGMFFLLIIGIAVFVAALVYLAMRWRRSGRRAMR
jgi:hypothetical protein